MTSTIAIEAVAPMSDVYRLPSMSHAATAGQASQFSAAMDQARAAGVGAAGAGDSYVRSDNLQAAASMGDGTLDRLGTMGTTMSHGFRNSIDEAFSKLSNIDFTEPSSMVTMLEVHLGVFSASTQVQFAAKVADFSVHGLTTLFRNQG